MDSINSKEALDAHIEELLSEQTTYRGIDYAGFSMPMSEAQKSVIEKAIALLKPYDKEDFDSEYVYFSEGEEGDDYESDFDNCGSKKCLAAARRDLRKSLSLPKYAKANIWVRWTLNNGDNDSIKSCPYCGIKQTGSLTWIGQELDHHENYITKDDLTDSSTAYDVRVMLESMPSRDHNIGGYPKHQYKLGNWKVLADAINGQIEFVQRVVTYAEKVVAVLAKEKPLKKKKVAA